MAKVYQPRMEIVSNHEAVEAWQDWGVFDNKSEAIKIAENLLQEIKEGKWKSRITAQEKAAGFRLNSCVEILDDETFDLLEIFEVA